MTTAAIQNACFWNAAQHYSLLSSWAACEVHVKCKCEVHSTFAAVAQLLPSTGCTPHCRATDTGCHARVHNRRCYGRALDTKWHNIDTLLPLPVALQLAALH